MDGGTHYSIGDLARRTGLTVKAIRFYSDRGIVPPTDRSPAGHRRYDSDAVARLDLVRTLRDVGLDLATIRKIVDREISLPEVAAAHAEALAMQIQILRMRHAVLVTAAKRGSTPEEMGFVHTLATLAEDERRRLIGEFLGTAFGGLEAPEFVAIKRSLTPELPDNPDADQVEAWVGLVELSQDPGFRASMRRMAEHHAADRAKAETTVPRRDPVAMVRDQAGPAVAAGIDPVSPQADPVVTTVVAHYARTLGRPDGADLRKLLLLRIEAVNDPRWERYLRLLAVINGWSAPDSLRPVCDWFSQALRVRIAA